MLVPAERPTNVMTHRLTMTEVAPTEATATLSAMLPSTMMSTALKSVCKKVASMTGML